MRTDPFRELDRLSRSMFSGWPRSAMPMDAYRDANGVTVRVDLPGVRPDDIDLTIDRDVLTVEVERKAPEDTEAIVSERAYGTVTRRLYLGESLDADKLEADYDNGVLTIRIPAAEHAKPRRIEIASGGKDRGQLAA